MEKVSILDNFNRIFANWFRTEALPHIANHFTNERKVPTTVDDLIKIFDLPYSPINPSNQTSFNTVMGLPTSASFVSNTPVDQAKTVTKQGRKKTPDDPSAAKCRYILTKGRPGQPCGSVCVAYGFCVTCISKGDSLITLEKEGLNPETIKKIKELKDSKPNLRAFLNDASSLSNDHSSVTGLSNSTQATQFNQQLVFHEIPGYTGFYIIKDLVPNAFFHRKIPTDPYVCIGKMEMKDGNGTGPFVLTNEEARLITSKGYTYIPPGDSKPQHPAAVNPNFVPNPVMSAPVQQQSNFTPPNPLMSNFVSPTAPIQQSNNPPTVIMPPFMNSSNTVSQMVGQSIMNAVPNIIKTAMDQNNVAPLAFSF